MKRKELLLQLLTVAAFSWIAVVAGSCTQELSPAEHGNLINGSFHYRCVDEVSDPACENAPDYPVFQEKIATGAQFSIWFVLHDNVPNEIEVPTIISPLPSYLERIYEDSMVKLRLLVTGYAPLHAQNGYNQVHDFVHLEGAEITELMVAKQKVTDENTWGDWDAKWEELVDTLVIETGQTVVVRVFPRDEELNILPGTILDYEWTPPDKTVAIFNPNTSPTLVNLVGVSPGTSSLTVELGDISKTVEVVVEEPSEEDAGVDSGFHFASDQGRF